MTPWTKEEDDQMIAMRDTLSDREIGLVIGRPEKGVRARASKLQLLPRTRPAPEPSPDELFRSWQAIDSKNKGDPATRVGWTIGNQFAAVA